MPMRWFINSILLAAYEFWLISFPMEGNLIFENRNVNLLHFLMPHTFALFISGKLVKNEKFDIISKVSTIFTILFTILFPIYQNYQPIILSTVGIFSSPLVIRVIAIVNKSTEPISTVGVGLAIGNLLVFVNSLLPVDINIKFFITAMSLTPIFFSSIHLSPTFDFKTLKINLPFLFLFYLIGGLFYGFIIKEYSKVAFINGLELLFYVILTLTGIFLIKKSKELHLLLGILFGMFAFSLYREEIPLLVNLSMFLCQASFGLIDLYLITLLLRIGCTIKTVGYGIGIISLAILSGKIISLYLFNVVNFLITIGNVILAISFLMFYFLEKKSKYDSTEIEMVNNIQGTDKFQIELANQVNKTDKKIEMFISHYAKKLSPKEKEVLRLVLKGKTYKEVANSLNISESSVKTYMKRVYEKIGVKDKRGIFEKMNEIEHT